MKYFQQQLRDQSFPEFRSMIGKKVIFKIENGERMTGILKFAGINNIHGKFQVTVNSTPFWPVDKNTLKLLSN